MGGRALSLFTKKKTADTFILLSLISAAPTLYSTIKIVVNKCIIQLP